MSTMCQTMNYVKICKIKLIAETAESVFFLHMGFQNFYLRKKSALNEIIEYK